MTFQNDSGPSPEGRKPQQSGLSRAGTWEERPEDLEAVVVRQLDEYFARLGGRDPHPLYELVISAVERPLLRYAMTMCRDNQSAAAQLLGINRNTLRKKLLAHRLLER